MITLTVMMATLVFFTDFDSTATAPSDDSANRSDEITYWVNSSVQAGYQGYTHSENGHQPYQWLLHSANLNGGLAFEGGPSIEFDVDAADMQRGWWISSFVDIAYQEDGYVRVGQFATPFSDENYQPTSSLDHIKRYHPLSSLHRFSLVGAGFGVMLHASENMLTYYLSATTNLSNHAFYPDRIQFQARADYQFSEDLTYGLSLLYQDNISGSLPLIDHSGNSFSELQINSGVLGGLLKSEWFYGRWYTRSELFTLWFTEPVDAGNQAGWYYGSYSELGVHLGSDRESANHHILGRLEASQYFNTYTDVEGTERIYSLMAGHIWHLHPMLSLRSNLVFHHADTVPVNTNERYDNQRYGFHGLMTLELKL